MTKFQDQLHVFEKPLAKKIFEEVPQTLIPKLAIGEKQASITKPVNLRERRVFSKHRDII